MLLAGAGHSHLVAIRKWIDQGWRAPFGTQLISATADAWYSGMMPGLIAGRFTEGDCAIALEPLCKAAGIELVVDEVSSLDTANRIVRLSSGCALEYEILSLDVGSMPPAPPVTDDSMTIVAAKPFASFTAQWRTWQREDSPQHLAVLGGGAAAFELAVALLRSLPKARISIISGAPLLAGHAAGVASRARRTLKKRGVEILEGVHVDRIQEAGLYAGDRRLLSADAVILATGASASPWLAASGLNCDDQGFVIIGKTLQSLSHPGVLASGDCASLPGARRSGVFAVRQGPTLADNIMTLTSGDGSMQLYHPRQQSLALLSTADGNAILSYGPLAIQGRLMGRWKDHLDLGFMRRHRLAD